MLRISIKDIKKYYDGELALEIEELEIFSGDKIGVVGANGSGKTTLLNILGGVVKDFQGQLEFFNDTSIKYINQFEEPENKTISNQCANVFNIRKTWDESMSGGEKTLFKLAEGFENRDNLLLIDEPTTNLDLDGIKIITENIKKYADSFLMISHDRNLLDNTCNKILEVDRGRVKLYDGNYSDYIEAKDYELVLKKVEYGEYLNKKRDLESIKESVRLRSKDLEEDSNLSAKNNLEDFVDTVQYRLERIEVKEEPIEEKRIIIGNRENSFSDGDIIIRGENINKELDGKNIFKNLNFQIENNSKIAIVGRNASGKSILLDMIINREEGIHIEEGIKIGYFNQEMTQLKEDQSLIDNIMSTSIYDLDFVERILDRFLIDKSQYNKLLSEFSSGEIVKIYFTKIILSDIDVLILDEPTIYLDILGLEFMEELLRYYKGSLILASHDRRFIENIVDKTYIIKNQKLVEYDEIDYI